MSSTSCGEQASSTFFCNEVDYTNIAHSRTIHLPASASQELMSAPRPGIGLSRTALGIVSLTPGSPDSGEFLYSVGLSSTCLCYYVPRYVG